METRYGLPIVERCDVQLLFLREDVCCQKRLVVSSVLSFVVRRDRFEGEEEPSYKELGDELSNARLLKRNQRGHVLVFFGSCQIGMVVKFEVSHEAKVEVDS